MIADGTVPGRLSIRKLPKNSHAPAPAMNARELRIIHALVPTLCVGTRVPTLCVEYGPNLRPKLREGAPEDATKMRF